MVIQGMTKSELPVIVKTDGEAWEMMKWRRGKEKGAGDEKSFILGTNKTA